MSNYLDEDGVSYYDGKIKSYISDGLSTKINTSAKGAINGVAELDSNGKVPSSQLPSYVDDTVEGYLYNSKWYSDSAHTIEVAGETGKIYVDLSTNKTYRWSGSAFVEISASLALGETSSTAYRGDRGNTAYTHSQSDHSGIKPAFTEASTRANIATGESIATVFGKIKKFFTDLKSVAFSGSYSDLSSKPANVFYGTCDSAADATSKVVTLADTSGWELKAGVIIGVKFTNTNTATANVTLDVNSSGNKSIYYNNAEYTAGNSGICGYAARTIYYMYDGTYWVWLNMGSLDGNTDNKVAQTVTTTNSTYEVLFSASTGNTTKTEGARKNNNLTFNPSTGNLGVTKINSVTVGDSPKFTDTTYENKTAVSGGTDVSLVTTGDKYDWDNKSDLALGETASTAYAGDKGKANTEAIEAIVNEYGAKNLLPNQSVDGTENGVTFTTNADGSITVNGTATATTNHIIYHTESTPDCLLNKDLIFSGCTGGTQQGTYRLWMGDKNWSGIVESTDGDASFSISQNKGLLCIIQVVGNMTMNNVTFYPMIRDARITDPTYVPYAMTNLDLTKMYESYKPALTHAGTGSSIIAYRIGRLVAVNVKLVLDAYSNIEINGLPAPAGSGEINNGFGIMARDQTDGSIVRMWTNGAYNILTGADSYTIGHAYGISYSYLTD